MHVKCTCIYAKIIAYIHLLQYMVTIASIYYNTTLIMQFLWYMHVLVCHIALSQVSLSLSLSLNALNQKNNIYIGTYFMNQCETQPVSKPFEDFKVGQTILAGQFWNSQVNVASFKAVQGSFSLLSRFKAVCFHGINSDRFKSAHLAKPEWLFETALAHCHMLSMASLLITALLRYHSTCTSLN